MKSKLCKVISSVHDDYAILPDLLHEKSKKNCVIDLSVLEGNAENDLNCVMLLINKKDNTFKFSKNDLHVFLRRILPREKEFTEQNSKIKEILSHICISHEVFKFLIAYHIDYYHLSKEIICPPGIVIQRYKPKKIF